MKQIRDLPNHDRPREKLLKNGPRTLSDKELVAVLLGSGTKEQGVMGVAARILKAIDEQGNGLGADQLQKIDGVGPAKAALLSAAMEFARRRIRPEGVKIGTPADVLPLIRHLADRKQEHFICISLNGANEVIANRTVTVGLVNRTQVHPREVFADPITDRASAVIVAHNHPAGTLAPSEEDRAITRRLRAAGETLGIKVLDHIIFSPRGYYSFLDHGGLTAPPD